MNTLNPTGHSSNTVVQLSLRSAEEVELSPGRLAPAIVIGQVARYFELSAFAICSALVFPNLLFPSTDVLVGMICCFAIFGLGLAVRPVGVALFDRIERQKGRAAKLISAVLLLCASTVAIGLAPGYAQLGPAAIGLLVLLRAGQGLATGGLGDGSAAMLALGRSAHRRSNAPTVLVGRLGGVVLAAGLFAYFAAGISGAEFIAWGWRFPFIIAVAVNLVALFARLRLMPSERLGQVFLRAG